MDLNPLLISLPAIVALIFKGAIFAYARLSKTHNRQTQLYLYFLFALSIQNVAEISGFYSLLGKGIIPRFEATVFYATSIIAIALLFHLTMVLAFNQGHNTVIKKAIERFVYLYAVSLEVLLIFTPWLITDFVSIGYSVTRVPGPLYFLFELFAMSAFLTITGMLVYGAAHQNTIQKRAKNSMFLVAIIPMALVVMVVLTLLRLGIEWINGSFTIPMALTYFLAITAYAIHQHRLFDIQFFVPWSKVRKRKTAFYHRIRAMIAEIADLDSVNAAISRLADTLRCPVALVGSGGTVIAQAGGADHVIRIPNHALHKFERIVVANEIADANPDTYTVMRRHDIAAIVPFYPHSQHASGWLLLGDSFSEQVYTPLDFRFVEQLFDKMAELFLDRLLAMRTQLADAHSRIQTLERQLQDTQGSLTSLRCEVDTLRRANRRLATEQPADSFGAVTPETPDEKFAATITVLGRDKETVKYLREHFPQVSHFVGPDSAGFKRQKLPDVLVCRVEAGTSKTHQKLLKLVRENHTKIAVLLYGPGARQLTLSHKADLLGSLIEVPPADISNAGFARKIRALAVLQESVHSVHDPDYPLIGRSQVFLELLTRAQRVAGFKEPVLIRTDDVCQAIALGAHMHHLARNEGSFIVVRTAELEERFGKGDEARISRLINDAHDGTLMIDSVCGLSQVLQDKLRLAMAQIKDVRVIAGAGCEVEEVIGKLRTLPGSLQPFVLEIPTLRQRKTDIRPFIHYQTLQFNLQAGTDAYLSQAEVDELLETHFPADTAALKTSVFAALQSKRRTPQALAELDYSITNKSLDKYVSEFEARLIAQTLERCDGNKSKAARLLGLRPNTLHYKMERYGLSGGKKR